VLQRLDTAVAELKTGLLALIPMSPESVVEASPPMQVGTGRGDKDPGNIFDNPLDPSNPGVDGDSVYTAPHDDGVVYTMMDLGTVRRVTVVECTEAPCFRP
jgi:hypothetical protein